MLRSLKQMHGNDIHAIDGEVGKITDAYFDDAKWVVRYLTAKTGGWLLGREVLLSPFSVNSVDWERRCVNLTLTKSQVEKSPDIDTEQPVSRQMELKHHDYYGYPYYWSGPGLWGMAASPFGPVGTLDTTPTGEDPYLGDSTKQASSDIESDEQASAHVDPHLRSVKEIINYHLQASDGEIGHVEDFIFDDQSWAIRYIVIDTRNWWPGKSVLVSPHWVEQIDWARQKISLPLHRDTIRNAPDYNPHNLSRDYEESLHAYYKKEGYWINDERSSGPLSPELENHRSP